jgi:predicted DNA binding CopG/RHH family protein
MPTQPKPKPRPVGRPKLAKGQAKGSIIPVRFSSDDRAKVEKIATAQGLSVSEWIRRTIHAAL